MSAAEKLEALKLEYIRGQDPYWGWGESPDGNWLDSVSRVLRDALPQIVAVVEAAEFSADVYKSTPIALVKALAALGEALG